MKKMNKSIYLVVVLTVTAAISGGILAYFDSFTSKRIADFQKSEQVKSVQVVLPGSVTSESKMLDGVEFFIGKDDAGKPVGVAFVATGAGFQSTIKVLVGMDPTMQTILAMKIMEQAETPGLGTKIVNDQTNKTNPGWFIKQFENLSVANGISYLKGQKPSKPGEIQAITGATVSSAAVVNLLNASITSNREIFLKNGVK
jgi:electron transport complex protein RnfG